MRSWFYKRSYPKDLVENEMGKVKSSGYIRGNKRERKGVPFVITYRPSLKIIGSIINQNFQILYMNDEAKIVFKPPPMIYYCNATKLSSCLVRAKLYPLESTVSSVQCKGKRCQTCHNVKETVTFTNTTTGKTFITINHKLNCNDKCLVYLLTCNVCLKQYVGTDRTITRAVVVITKIMAYVCKNTVLSILLRRDTTVFWKMSLLH